MIGRRDRGSAAVELVLLTPVLVVLLLFVVIAGRSGTAFERVRHAADQGARAASMARPAAATTAARSAVLDDLRTNDVSCRSPAVAVSHGVSGDLITVTVRVSCTVGRQGLSLLGAGQRTVTASSTEVLDRYRSWS